MKAPLILILIGAFLLAGHASPSSRQISPHGDLKMNCNDCHSPQRWKPTKRNIDFDHGKTGFPLSGSHAAVSCMECHKDLKFQSVSSSCADCHQDIHKGKFGTDCQACHTTKKWSAEFLTVEAQAHNEFPLVGFHAIDECAKCHKNQEPKNYANTPTNCSSCHMGDFDQTTSPSHKASNFSTDCASCHASAVISGWRGGTGGTGGMTHPATLPLTGAHGKISCYDCHSRSTFAGLDPECATCHQADYDQSTKPNHKEAAFPTDCAACHSNENWRVGLIPEGTSFKHPQTFPLTGGHAKPKCAECHTQGYVGTKAECVGCHEKDFAATTQPNHAEQKFSMNCAQCHNTGEWKGAMIPPGTDFQHPATFPLKGGHGIASCADCHKDGKYTDTPTDCLACHQGDYDTATSPNHLDLNFGTNCSQCHTINSWLSAVIPPAHPFKHPVTFPLEGAHNQVDCQKCHSQGYSNTPTDCASCHDKDFQAAIDPNHLDLKFSKDCAQCHKVVADWKGAVIPPNSTFQHPATFPLAGGHSGVSCSDCHAKGYTGTPTECVSCHLAAFEATTNPKHADLNFSTDCKSCHTVSTWKGAQIDPRTPFQHPVTFPLAAGHANVSCMECHANGYTNTPKDCNSCHNDDYVAAVPNHANLAMPTQCALCHGNVTWKGATIPPNIAINHPATFPLTRPHDQAKCTDCHSGGYTTASKDCYACHKDDFERVQSPNHVTGNYSKSCLTCHKPDTWDGATFDHERYFPIARGNHSGLKCTECHKVADNYKAFECILCHEHSDRAKVDADHRGEGGYRYTSEGCYSCHPRGN